MAYLNTNSTGQPLFIVDRDWLKQGSKGRKSWTGNVRNRSLYGLAIQVTEYDACEKGSKPKTKSRPKRTRLNRQDEASGSDEHSEREQDVQYAPQVMQTESAVYAFDFAARLPAATTNYSGSISAPSADAPWSFHQVLQSSLSPALPAFEQIRGLECYADYYLDVIGTSQRPIESKSRQQSNTNTTRSSWFPLAFEDDLWLQNIAMFSAMHHASNRNEPAPEPATALMSSFLAQLNERISRSDLSDATIASVSCLTLLEHLRGNDKLSEVHAGGLAEMVRLRGGLYTIQRARRAKIVRADIVRGVDNMKIPLLARLTNDFPASGPHSSTTPVHFENTIAKLSRAGVSTDLITILWSLGSVCQNLEIAWAGASNLDATAYYEDVLCLNHDLLSLEAVASFDEVLRISILNFTQPLFRYCAFGQRSCRLRSIRLKLLIEKIDTSLLDDGLLLWIMLNGYMTSYRTSLRPWYRTRLAAIMRDRGIPPQGAWEQVKANLQRFLWTDSIHDPIGKQFYDSLEQSEDAFTFQDPCHSCGGSLHNFGSTPSPAPPSKNSLTSSPKDSAYCQMTP